MWVIDGRRLESHYKETGSCRNHRDTPNVLEMALGVVGDDKYCAITCVSWERRVSRDVSCGEMFVRRDSRNAPTVFMFIFK